MQDFVKENEQNLNPKSDFSESENCLSIKIIRQA